MKTSGNTVLVTGGGSGIGLALARAFLERDNKVLITGRNRSKLEQVKAEHPDLEIAQCDVTDEAQIQALVERCDEEFGGIDVLVNNAGVFQYINEVKGNFSLEHKLQEVDIDLNGPIRMLHYFLPKLLAKKEAAVVNVSSGLAFVPLVVAPVYCATKAAMHHWTLALRWQLEKTSVKVFELMPPVVDTPMVSDLEGFPKMPAEELADAFMKGFAKDKWEITPGQSSQLKLMRRLAPGFILKAVNGQTDALLAAHT